MRALTAVATGVLAFYAFATLPLAQTYAILFASPLLITVLAIPLLGEKVRARRWAAVVAGLIGVLIVLRPGAVPFEWGHLAAILAAVSGATGAIAMRKIGGAERSAVIFLYPLLATLGAMGAALPFVYRPMPLAELAGMGLIALMAFAAMLCLIGAYRRAEAVVIAPMQYSQIIWATLYGYLLFDEGIDLSTAIGAGIVIASGVYIVFREASAGASETKPVLRAPPRPGPGAR
jgi:drug/metabolite transporter (DMT)-like permease